MKTALLLATLVLTMEACDSNRVDNNAQQAYKPDSTVYNMHRAIEIERHRLEPVYVKPDLDIYTEGDTVQITLENHLILPANSPVGPSTPVVLGKFVKKVKLPANIIY